MNLGLAAPTEIMDALCFQNEQRSLGNTPPRIGRILMDRGVLGPDDVARVMEEIEFRTKTLLLPGFQSLELVERDATTLQFRGTTIGTRKTVVIRILRFALAESPDDTERFLSEAETLSRLDHPNVVRVLATGELEAIPYLVLENVVGPTLENRVEEDGPLAEEDALSILAQAAAGLDHAHRADVCHGSVGPASVLLPRIGPVKVTDFALFDWCSFASAQGTARLEPPWYLSPEQARKSTRATVTSDVYSLGATLFFMLTGRPPFRGTHLEILRQHRKRPAPDPRVQAPDISKSTANLVARMLAKQPEDRPRSMEEVIRLARRSEHGTSETADDPILPDRLRPGRRG
ncbi:MAG: serine/threonine-protein kinase [Planctomycetota bacterium]